MTVQKLVSTKKNLLELPLAVLRQHTLIVFPCFFETKSYRKCPQWDNMQQYKTDRSSTSPHYPKLQGFCYTLYLNRGGKDLKQNIEHGLKRDKAK